MTRIPAVLAIALAAFPSFSQAPAPDLGLPQLPSLVLAHDTAAAVSAQSTLLAYHVYQGTIAQAYPQLDLSTTYSLAFSPDIKSQVLNPPLPAAEVDVQNQGTHLLGAKLSVSQLLPTAGNIVLALEDTMSMSTVGSRTVGGSTTNPDPLYSQKPRFSLGLVQPLFLNGKLLDLDLFPATLRKAQLGYLAQDLANQAQRNQAVSQAAQIFLSIVQLRKGVAQSESALAVAEGNLAALQQNFSLGSIAEVDLLDAKIGLSRQKQALAELRSTLAKTERLLAHSLGRDTLEGLTLGDDIPVLDIAASRDEIAQKALAGHPLIRAKGLSAEEKRVDDVLAGQQYAATFNLSLSLSPRYPFDAANSPYTTTDVGASFADLFKDGAGQDYALSAGLTIRLFDGGKQEQSRAGNRALAAIADQGLIAQRQAVLDQLDLDLMQKAALEEKITLLEESVSLGEKRLANERNLLARGKTTEREVAAKRADSEARANELWRARADLLLTVLDLYSLAGEDLAKTIEGTRK